MINAFLQYNFLQNAVFSAVMASIVCGIMGSIIVEKRLVMMSGGVAHAAFGGIGLGYFLNIEPIIGALFFSVFSAIGVVKLKRNFNTHTDTLIGIFWSLGMAVGILFVALTPGYPPQLSSYLFGDILTVTAADLRIMFLMNIIILIAFIPFFNYWKAYLFDEEFLAVRGLNTALIEYTLFILIALTVIVLIRIVGIVLLIALLTAPPAIASFFTSNFKVMILVSITLGLVFAIGGLFFSYYFDIPSGATIIMLAGVTYLGIALIKKKNPAG